MNNSQSQNAMPSVEHAYNQRLHRLALLTTWATFFLIIVGGLVTSNDAGDSVPDWPLSFGQVVPWQQLVGGVIYEYGHRVIASTVGLLAIILNVFLWRHESRLWVRRFGLIALVIVIAQGVLGGVRVLLVEYRFPAAITHAFLAQFFFSLTVGLTVFTSRQWFELAPVKVRFPGRLDLSVFYLCVAASMSIFGQLLLGAAFRHRGLGIFPHILGAIVVAVLLGWTIIAVLNRFAPHLDAGVRNYFVRPAKVAAVLLAVQLALGVGAYVARAASLAAPGSMFYMVLLTVTHVAGGALTLAITIILLLRVYRVMNLTEAVVGVPPTPSRVVS